jgi:long-chain acyl-CoA synthetase
MRLDGRGVRNEARTVLVTGTTGLVGGELLRRLLARGGTRVVCLVRATDEDEARQRGAATLRRLHRRSAIGEELARTVWVPGDVAEPDLGLSEPRHRALAASLDEILHCAASVSFDLPLAEAERINVGGARHVLALARRAVSTGRLRRLQHVSTAFASGRACGRVRAGELPPDEPRRFRNTYERTKARAERLLRGQSEVPVTIYRPSIIVGDSRDGRTSSWNVVYYPMRLMAAGALPVAPSGGAQRLDCVPVDFVADAMLALGARDDTVGRCHHLTMGDDALTVRDVVQATYAGLARHRGEALRVRTRVVGRAAWWLTASVYRATLRGRARRAFEKFAAYVPYTRVSSIYDNAAETTLLAAAGVAVPRSAEFFPTIVRYALEQDFGRRPDAMDETPAPPAAAPRVRGAALAG